jgi:hypothetical protein
MNGMLIVVRVVGGVEYVVTSQYLPPVGSKLTLEGPKLSLRVTEIDFVGEGLPESMSAVSSGVPLQLPKPLIPYLTAVLADY